MRSMNFPPGLYRDLTDGGVVLVSRSKTSWYGEVLAMRGNRIVRKYTGHRAWKLAPVSVEEATDILTGMGSTS